ncbi:SPOR domain-containing protein [Paraburkholderia caballeronis]|uniref:SPOR domain-containing protein n=1 Tax=Paraburkholderia caballeronis TaxID=416943 RepID=UPI0010661AE0|nr:SPOR domain-containing protein [Paraburkholderia caballeronis]TDV19314.1 DedD protein [Paraburkholderia caballeronis]TDV21914.1 DedD protein [Paraburkholderia caballeronis]TDV28817.1 DedD protein [Paraburkholderia caballeronis]
MGIFSFGKKDEAPARRGSNAGASRRSNQGARVERRSRRPDRSSDAEAMLLDPTLPEKQRARRRLVGAIALVIAAVIVLPMILDSHPKPVTDDIAIDIPSRPAPKAPADDDAEDTQAGVAPDNPPAAEAALGASGLSTAGNAPAPAAAQKSAPSSTQTAQATPPAAPAKQSAPAKPPAQTRADNTPPAAKPAQRAPAATTAQRQAAPSDTDVEPNSSSSDDAGTPSAPPGARYALQLGSFPDDASARSWATKLKAAGVPAYTEHRKQPDGTTRTLLRAGPFADRAAASAAIAKVRAAGLGSGANSGGAE